MPRPTLASLLEDFRNWNKTQDWMLNKQRDIYGNEDPDTIALNEKLAGIGTADMGMMGSSVGGLAAMLKPSMNNLSDIVSQLEKSGLKVDASYNPQSNVMSLSRLVVPEDMRGQGIGTQAMQDLVNFADQQNAMMALTPSTDFGATSVNRLKDFYKRFGFVPNAGRNKDYSISETMYRPQK